MSRLFIAIWVALSVALPAAVSADSFRMLDDRAEFISAVEGRKLTRFGIELDVTASGQIVGRAFGRPVSGAWRWRDGYFCRDLFWGQRDLGPNCQAVLLDGNTMRFVSDRGTGEFADLRLTN
jgi:hypothetical protein